MLNMQKYVWLRYYLELELHFVFFLLPGVKIYRGIGAEGATRMMLDGAGT